MNDSGSLKRINFFIHGNKTQIRSYMNIAFKDEFSDLLNSLGKAYEPLRQEGYDFESIKATIRSKDEGLVQDLRAALCSLKTSQHIGSVPFIGLGNPNADILIIGNEINIKQDEGTLKRVQSNWTCSDAPGYYFEKLFTNHAVLNLLLWQLKMEGVVTPDNFFCDIEDPMFPPSFCHLFNKEKFIVHSWFLINKACQRHFRMPFPFNTNNYSESFLSKVFLTELCPTPISLTLPVKSKDLAVQRFEFLIKSKFYGGFKTIIISNYLHLSTNIPNFSERIQQEFQVERISNFKQTKNIKEVYKSADKKVLVTRQLNGGAGWKTSELSSLFSI